MIKLIAYSSDLDMWFFDDARLGITAEAFVDGADQLLTDIVKSLGIAREHDGIYRVAFEFSTEPAPASVVLGLTDESSCFGDDYMVYAVEKTPSNVRATVSHVGLCPTLFMYFDDAPIRIFITARGFTD